VLRLFDIVLSSIGLLLTAPLLLLLTAAGLLDTGSPFFRQTRVGRNKKPFTLVKFRTMRPDTAHVATHLANPAAVTPLGKFLRRTKLDELPQLWNVLKGEMSLVGPRPCLPDQQELKQARDKHGVFGVRPGITGLGQINGIDMSSPQLLAETDARMIASLDASEYCRLLLLTLRGRGFGDRLRTSRQAGCVAGESGDPTRPCIADD